MDTKGYTIQQISEMTGLSAHTLRFYEKAGLLNGVQRDANRYRQYTESDIAWIQFLMRLRATGMKVKDMERFAELRSQGEATIRARRDMLEAHQSSVLAQIDELNRCLETIRDKIDHYKRLEGRQ